MPGELQPGGTPRMRVVNRAAIIVRPKAPYVQWAASLDAESADLAPDLHGKVSIYLVPEDMTGEEETPPLELFFRAIFEHELEAWTEDRAEWPQARDLKTFREWFDVARESVVVDLGQGELEIEVL